MGIRAIVIVTNYPPHQIGGYELRCRDLIEALKNRGHQIEVLTSRCEHCDGSIHIYEQEIYRRLFLRTAASNVFAQILHDCVDLNFV